MQILITKGPPFKPGMVEGGEVQRGVSGVWSGSAHRVTKHGRSLQAGNEVTEKKHDSGLYNL